MQSNKLNTFGFGKLQRIPLIEEDGSLVPDIETVRASFEKLSKQGFTDWEYLVDELATLKFTKEELDAFVVNNQPIPSYDAWRAKLDNYYLNKQFSSEILEENEPEQTKSVRTVLNHQNPFADVVIENQSFLYPSKNGYQTLQFATNNHFGKHESEQGEIYALTPGFKVGKQESRVNVTTILANDSVSTPLPKEKAGKQIYYI